MPANRKIFIAVTSPYSAVSLWLLGDGTYERRSHVMGGRTTKSLVTAHEAASVVVDTHDINDRGRGSRVHSALKGRPFAAVFARLADHDLPREFVD